MGWGLCDYTILVNCVVISALFLGWSWAVAVVNLMSLFYNICFSHYKKQGLYVFHFLKNVVIFHLKILAFVSTSFYKQVRSSSMQYELEVVYQFGKTCTIKINLLKYNVVQLQRLCGGGELLVVWKTFWGLCLQIYKK